MKKVFSYSRISSSEQRKGRGLKRQADMAAEYAAEHNYELVELSDSGVSAFKAKNNATHGKLAVFIQAITDGMVEPGSILLVEALDRLSRDDMTVALEKFLAIINRGVEVHTLADGKVYVKGCNLADIMMSIIMMCTANQESVHKSNRGKKNWEAIRDDLRAGKAAASHVPRYIKRIKSDEGDRYELPEENKKLLTRIVKMYLDEDMGYRNICRELNDEGIKNFMGRKWATAGLNQMLQNVALMGNYAPESMKGEVVEGLFPAAITVDTWNRLLSRRREKASPYVAGRTGGTVYMFKNIIKCGECGESMFISQCAGHSYYRCASQRNGVESCCNGGMRVDEVDVAVFEFLAGVDFAAVFSDQSAVKVEQDKLDALAGEIVALEAKQENLLDALESSSSKALTARLDKVEADIVKAIDEREAQAVALSGVTPGEADISFEFNPATATDAERRKASVQVKRVVKEVRLRAVPRKRNTRWITLIYKNGLKQLLHMHVILKLKASLVAGVEQPKFWTDEINKIELQGLLDTEIDEWYREQGIERPTEAKLIAWCKKEGVERATPTADKLSDMSKAEYDRIFM